MGEEQLKLSILADISNLKAGMKEATSSISGFKDKSKNVLGKVGKGFKTVAKGGAVIAAGVGVAVGAVVKATTAAADYGDAVHKASQKVGVSTDAFQEYDYWAGQNGISTNNMEKAVGRFNQRMGEAASDQGSKYNTTLEKLGVNMEGVRDGSVSTEDAFSQSIKTLSEMTDENEKVALATDMFGTKLARELLPALNDGSMSLEEAKAKAQELGIVLDEESINAAAGFNDAMDDVKRSLGMIMTKIGVGLMPIVQGLMDWVLANMPTIQAVFSAVFSVVGKVVSTAADIFRDYVMPVISAVIEWIKANLPAIKDSANSVFDGIKSLWANVLKPVWDTLMNVVKLVLTVFQAVFPVIQSIVKVAFDMIKTIWNSVLRPVFDKVSEIVKYVKGVFQDNMPQIQKIFGNMGKTIENVWNNTLKPAFEAVGAIVSWLLDKFTQYILPIVKLVFEAWLNIAETITEFMSKASDTVKSRIDLIRGFFDKISETVTAVKGFFTDIYNGIKEKIEAAKEVVVKLFTAMSDHMKESIEKAKEIVSNILEALQKVFETIFEAIKTVVVTIFTHIKDTIQDRIELATKIVTTTLDILKTVFTTIFEAIKTVVMTVFNHIKDTIESRINLAKNIISTALGLIKAIFSGDFGEAKNIVINIFDSIKTAISDKINAARDAVGRAIEKIKSFFKFEWSLPKLKVPSFKISGKFSLNPPSVPRFNINWNARGAIFKKPTVLANGQGVGDASNGRGSAPEVVAPLSDLKQMLGLDDGNKGNTIINLNGSYGFRDKDDMDYFMNELALASRRG